MRIARLEGHQGPELALVAPDGATWQRSGIGQLRQQVIAPA